MENENSHPNIQRTEEIQDIIDRMPTTFSLYITYVVLGIISTMLFFGFIIKYPDVIKGNITINAKQSPVKLVAPISGRIVLDKIKSQDQIKQNQTLAWIENSAKNNDIAIVATKIGRIRLPIENAKSLYLSLPRSVALGEINPFYFKFVNALKQLTDFQTSHGYDKQFLSLNRLITEQKYILKVTKEKKEVSEQNLALASKFYSRDSILHSKKVLSTSDLDQSKRNFIITKDQDLTMLRDIATNRETINQSENKLQMLKIEGSERSGQLNLEVITALNDLQDNLKSWQQKFLFKAPFSGKVQFLKFWTSSQHVQAGEAVFTIVPVENTIKGELIIPAVGAGKVKVGQTVIIKLADYPFQQYGSIKGILTNISLTTNTVDSEGGKFESYLGTVVFPNELKTNYGTKLKLKSDIKGLAEIITEDRKLIQRFFDNLKYKTNE